MKYKTLRFMLVSLLMMVCGTVFAGVSTKSITFKEGSGTGDSSTKVNTIANIISEGADYVSAITTADNVYNARQGRGIKLGTSSKTGTLVLTLTETVKPSKITFDARQYNASETSITVNGQEETGLTANFDTYTINYDGNTEVSTISISSSKRAYITNVTIYEGGEIAAVATPTFTPNGGTFVGTTSVEIACETEGATIYYSMNGQDPVAGSSPQYGRALPITETTTVKAIAVKGDDQSAVASATFTQIPSYSSFTAMSSLASNDIFAYTGKAFIIAKPTSKYVYLYNPDERDFALIYDQTGEKSVAAEVGKYITPGWTGKVSIFKKLFELVPDNALTVTDDPAQPVNYPAIVLGNAVMNQVITLKDVTYYAVDGKNISITVNNEDKDISEAQGVYGYNQFGIEIPTFVEGKTYQIVGAIGQYNDNVQFWPIEITEQVEETPEPDPEFYIVGTMTNWQIDPNYKMTLNEKAGEGIKEFSVTMTLAAGDEFKAVSSTDGTTIKTYFPDGIENNYVISEAGDYTIYFRPNADGGDDWHYKVLYAAKKAAPVYIETDLTAQFNSLANTQWTGSSGQVGWAAPKVTTNSGLEVAAWEKYNGSCDWTGEIMSSSVTGLTPGTYKIELYGAAAFTFGRGFGSTDFTGDFTKDTSENYKENDAITENTGVTLFAETSEGTVSREIPIWYATNFNTSGIATATLENVVVGDAGTIKIGLSKTSTSTNWHVVQLKGVTAQVDAVELHASVLAAAQAALNAEENAIVTGEEKTALENAIRENSTVAEQTADAYKAAIKALSDATAAFTGAKAAYQALADAQAYLVDLPYADAAKKPAAEAATNAADATAKAEALMVALRAYYESAALAEGVEGAKVMTDSIKNPKAEDSINNWTVVLGEGSGGNIDVKSNEPWTDAAGVADHKYFDGGDWGAQAWDVALEQKIALPAGKYLLTTIARAEKAVDLTLYAGADSVKMPAISSVGGVFNRGWNNAAVEFEMAEADSIVIGVRGVTKELHNWMSFSDFRLMQIEAPAVAPTYYVVGTMNDWTPSDEYKMTLNEEAEGVVEYMITLDLEANAELKVVKNNSEVWYPEGTDNNFQISEAGEYDIYFRPNADGGDDWHYNVLYVSKEVEPIYIETDLTSQFSALTDWTKWTGATGYTATNFCPKVTTNAGQEVQVCEKYETTCANTGDVFYQTVTGLTPGTYKIELYGGAAFTFGRGFGSMAFTGDLSVASSETYQAGDKIEPTQENPTGVTLSATTSEGVYGGEIPIYYATNFPDGAATVVLDGVVVGENGEVKIGMSKTSQSTNWHVIQLKGVTAQVNAVELHASVLAAAQAALNAEENAIVTGEEKTALENAISENATVAEQTADAYKAAIKALSDATAAFTGAKAAYEEYAAAQAYLVDLPYADAAKKPAAETATNAADATAKAEALMVALRAYYESAALAEGVEGAKVMTDSIKNPKAEDGINNWTVVLGEGSGGNIDVKSNEPWTDAAGVAEHKYFDGGNWGAQAWDVALEQKIALPAGKYLLTTIARAEKAVDLTLYAGADSVKMPAISSVGGVFNRGWNNAAVEFEMAEADSIVIGVRGVTAEVHNWMSFADFRLVQLEESAEPAELEKFYIMGTGTANEWNGTTEMAYNEEAQAFEYTINSESGAWIAFGDVEFTNWDDFNANHRYAIGEGDQKAIFDEAMQLQKVNGTIALPAGKFNVSVTKDLLCTITEVVAPATHTWDFTKWSEATVTNLKAEAAKVQVEDMGEGKTNLVSDNGALWSDHEKATQTDPSKYNTTYAASKDNCFWYIGGEAQPTANSEAIAEFTGLEFNTTYGTKRSLAIAVNYPVALNEYAGPSYLWFGGKNSEIMTIKNVKAGTQIKMGVESHKAAEARGVKLFVDGTELTDPEGAAVAAPTTYTEQAWQVPAGEGVVDVVVKNTNGCHIYFIDAEIGEPAETIESMYIMGDFTGGWEFDDTQKMTQNAENEAVWTLTVEGFEAEAKTYEYKATANGKWGVYELPGAGANNNFVFGTDEYPAGKYDLTFTVNTTDNTLTLVATKHIEDGITMLKAAIENGNVYNMNGQKVNKAQKGLYIINGRKVVIK